MNNNQLSIRVRRNNLKAFCLEEPINEILENMKIDFQDTTHIFNFKNKSQNGIPDFTVKEDIAIELKNWNCQKYTIDSRKALREIAYRFLNCWDKRKILIITNPKWCKRVKEWLLACGIEVYEVGEFVTKDIFHENSDKGRRLYNTLTEIIRTILGYVHRSDTVSTVNVRSSIYDLNQAFTRAFKRPNMFRTRLKHGNSTSNKQFISGLHRSHKSDNISHTLRDNKTHIPPSSTINKLNFIPGKHTNQLNTALIFISFVFMTVFLTQNIYPLMLSTLGFTHGMHLMRLISENPEKLNSKQKQNIMLKLLPSFLQHTI